MKGLTGEAKSKAGRAARLAIAIAGACIFILLAAGPALSQTVSAYTILDDATGGDCATIGAWDQYGKTCTLTGDVVTSQITIGSSGITLDGAGHSVTGGGAYGVYLDHIVSSTIRNLRITGFSYGVFLGWSDGNTISGNTVDGCTEENIGIWGSANNMILRNTISNAGWDGIGMVGYSYGNIVQYNTISGNQWGVWENQASGNTTINNNFINNAVQAEIASPYGPSTFFTPETGGNYWSNWTAPDANGDGIVDVPYVLTGGQDDMPYTIANGWLCRRPGLSLTKTGARWASYADFLARELSIDFSIGTNDIDAYNVTVVGAASTNGVTMASVTPVVVGNVNAGTSVTLTLKYHVQSGVNSFRTTTYASAADACGKSYDYPGPYPGV